MKEVLSAAHRPGKHGGKRHRAETTVTRVGGSGVGGGGLSVGEKIKKKEGILTLIRFSLSY